MVTREQARDALIGMISILEHNGTLAPEIGQDARRCVEVLYAVIEAQLAPAAGGSVEVEDVSAREDWLLTRPTAETELMREAAARDARSGES